MSPLLISLLRCLRNQHVFNCEKNTTWKYHEGLSPPKPLSCLWLCTWMSVQYSFVLGETINFLNWIELNWTWKSPYVDKTVFILRRGPVSLHALLAATKQLYEWFSPSVRLSVCLSVTPFWLCYHHCIIMKFSGVITKDQGKVHAKGQGQRSKVKVTEVTTQLNRFRTVTPVWIHIWW